MNSHNGVTNSLPFFSVKMLFFTLKMFEIYIN